MSNYIVEIAKIWKPKDGEPYYVPTVNNKSGYQTLYWADNDYDKFDYDRLLVCKTKEEAIELAGKMLTFTKNTQEGKNNG